ncbi:MAG TPA: tetraacyldisaccharide 4'-kinase [Gemmatimonadales bacterium]|nr:tetraacyldisaccharide 4'-kinase [Gemmatimonadales bacterium]
MIPQRRGDGHRVVRWLWTSGRPGARAARGILWPASGLWAAGMAARQALYRRGWLQTQRLGRPTVAVGNLSVGGSGKTPLAGWVAAHYAARGLKPGILLRGVGGDEEVVHREAVPSAIVVADADRVAGAVRAIAAGADVLVLDDAYQRLDVARDLNICLVAAETSQAVRWLVPAGPWRESIAALRRADLLIVTRKRADADTASRLAAELAPQVSGPVAIARLDLSVLRGLVSGTERPVADLAGRRVVAASAIADPEAFVAQVKRTGAQVQVATWKDHHQFRDEDLAWLAHAARRADHVVVTAKDAVKLRDRWPASVPEPLVAMLAVTFEAGEDALRAALDRVVGRAT